MPSRSSKKTAKKKRRTKKRDRTPRQRRDGLKTDGKAEPISLYPLSFDEAMQKLLKASPMRRPRRSP